MKKLVSAVLFAMIGLAIATVATPTAKITAAASVEKSRCCDFPPPPPNCPPDCSPAAK